jgi:hypothetical protein
MSFSAATSGQIVVPASRLFVYALQGSAESCRECLGTRRQRANPKYTSAWHASLFAAGRKTDIGHIQCPNTITTRRNAVLLAF